MLKKVTITILLILFITSVQAQRRYGHVPRVKLEKVEVADTLEEEFISVKESYAPILIEKNAPTQIKEIIVPEFRTYTPPRIKKTSPNGDQFSIKESDIRDGSFLVNILKEHKKLSEVKEPKKTLLRTWKWLLIVACILIVAGLIFFLLLTDSALKHSLVSAFIVVGSILVSIGLISAIIILILGLSGRI